MMTDAMELRMLREATKQLSIQNAKQKAQLKAARLEIRFLRTLRAEIEMELEGSSMEGIVQRIESEVTRDYVFRARKVRR